MYILIFLSYIANNYNSIYENDDIEVENVPLMKTVVDEIGNNFVEKANELIQLQVGISIYNLN